MRDMKLAGCVHWSSHFTSGIGGRRGMDDIFEHGVEEVVTKSI
jgi:hypothetical protein